MFFGSVARGDADRQSDIDLWVLTERNQQHEANQLAKRLESERFDGERYEFQILLETLASAAVRESDLVDVFSEGIRLYSRPQFESLERQVLDRA